MFGRLQRLHETGVLGMNRRNLEFIFGYNPRHYYPLVDDKLQTKRLAEHAGIAIPSLYRVIDRQYQVRQLADLLAPYPDFVIKPAHGSGGDGIVIIAQQHEQRYRKVNGEVLSLLELQHHLSSILGGLYSLGGQTDAALIEYRIQFDSVFADITYQGVPDIRLIVFLGVPVMAMLRLPTRQSQGRANLHQGAVGVGIDIASGQTTSAVHANVTIEEHPETGHRLRGVQVPHWDGMLLTAAQCYELTEMGYVGVDFVLDKDKGPLLLELNARPGLNIQIANRAGLLPRLRQVQAIAAQHLDPEQRVAMARQCFAV
jgi:alpha-L-glutamate ligase-like protein